MRSRMARLAAAGVVVALAASALTVAAVTTGAKTYTGCLTVSGGTLTLIKEGQSPQKPCPSGTVQVRLGEGDITSVLTSAGSGLTGGGTSGDVSLSIATGFRLPQGCAAGKLAKWDGDSWECADDADTTYTAGDGLVLTGTEFSLDPSRQLPDCGLGEAVTWVRTLTSLGEWGCSTPAYADQSCAAGKVVTGIDAEGTVTCGTAAAAASPVTYVATSSAAQGLPDDDAWHTIVSLSPGAGTYFVVAKGTVNSQLNVDSFREVSCELRVDSSTIDTVSFGSDSLNTMREIPIALAYAAPATGTIALRCIAGDGADGISLDEIRLVALRF